MVVDGMSSSSENRCFEVFNFLENYENIFMEKVLRSSSCKHIYFVTEIKRTQYKVMIAQLLAQLSIRLKEEIKKLPKQ